jgi:lysozyme family protein
MDVLSQAIDFTLGEEGGYSNHPADKGGATNFGITQKTLDRWNSNHQDLSFPISVKDLTRSKAETIYRSEYWRWDGIDNASIAIKVFDIGVNCGLTSAVRLLQRALNASGYQTAVDGSMGPRTLAAVNAANPETLMNEICKQQEAYYYAIVTRDQSQSVFLKGWLKRAALRPKVID